MTPAAMRFAPAILDHLTEGRELSSLPLTVRSVWLYLSLAMIDRPHTGHGLNPDPERLAELVTGRLGEVKAAVTVLLEERMLECSADGYLRSPFVNGLLRPAATRR